MTFWGGLISLIFLVCYLGQSISSGLEGRKARILQWFCWILATVAMLLCYLLTETSAG